MIVDAGSNADHHGRKYRALVHETWRALPLDEPEPEPGRPPQSTAARWLDNRLVRQTLEVGGGAVIFYWALQWLWPTPKGVVVQGIIIGSLTALISFGIALIYRSNRVLNFAQADLGAVPATIRGGTSEVQRMLIARLLGA